MELCSSVKLITKLMTILRKMIRDICVRAVGHAINIDEMFH